MQNKKSRPLANVSKARWGIAAFVLCLSLYLLRLDSLAGALIDDGWYMLLGKAIATGQGYTLINSPSPGMVPFYPPAFPALLSLVFRLFPSFPANIWILKVPSLISLLLSGVLIYYYLVRIHELNEKIAFGVTLLTLVTPALVFLATSTLMSEVFFMFVQTATIVAVELSLRVTDKRKRWLLVIAASCLATVAFLTKSIAVGLLIAVGVYFLLNRRALYALAFSLVVCVLLAPWLLYKQHHPMTAAQAFEQRGYITQSYVVQFWQRSAGDEDSGTTPYRELPKRVFIALSDIYSRDLGGLTVPALYRESEESGMEVRGMNGEMGMATTAMAISYILSALCVLGFIGVVRRKFRLSELTLLCTLPVILSWPWLPFRFLLPFTPFIFFYLVSGINVVWLSALRSLRGSGFSVGSSEPMNDGGITFPVRIFLMSAILLNLYDHTNYLLGKFHLFGSSPALSQSVGESDELIKWMRTNLESNAVVASDNPPYLYLCTGLKTVSPSSSGKTDELVKRKVDYVVHISPLFPRAVLTDDERKQIVYQTNQLQFFVLKLKKS